MWVSIYDVTSKATTSAAQNSPIVINFDSQARSHAHTQSKYTERRERDAQSIRTMCMTALGTQPSNNFVDVVAVVALQWVNRAFRNPKWSQRHTHTTCIYTNIYKWSECECIRALNEINCKFTVCSAPVRATVWVYPLCSHFCHRRERERKKPLKM